jgi:hypothetical protein
MTVLESILKDLETLPTSKLMEVAHYISGQNPHRQRERIEALKATSGCMMGDEGAEFERVVIGNSQQIGAP